MKTLARRLFAVVIYYPSLLYNMAMGRWFRLWNWWDIVDDTIVLGAKPFAGDVASLFELGVRSVVNTCEEYEGPVDQYAKYDIDQLRVPTIDFVPPTLESVTEAVEYIERRKGEGRVYVHCKAGRARSATVVICWLMKQRTLDPKQAESLLRSKRQQVLNQLSERSVVQEFYQRFVEPQAASSG